MLVARALQLVVAGGVLLAASLSLAEPVERPLHDDDIVARVNGTPIHRKEVRQVVQAVLLAQGQEPSPSAVAALARQALDSLVSLELLFQASRARGITISDDVVNAEVSQARSQFPDEASFDSALRSRGITVAELRQETRKTLAAQQYLDAVLPKPAPVTDEQARTYYEKNREQFKHPDQIRVSHILIRTSTSGSATDQQAARTSAAEVSDRLKKGADFAQVARERSQDPGSAPEGGDLGFISRGDTEDAFENAAFALAPGQVSGVIETRYGFHVIKVTERRPAGEQPFSEVAERIRGLLAEQAREQQETELIVTLRKKAKIENLEPMS